MRKWTDEALHNMADQTNTDIMEDIAAIGRDNVDPMEWIVATAEVENIHDEDREVFFHMMGLTLDPFVVMQLASH